MRERAGQITVEYFLLFAAIILVTMISLSTFHTDISKIFKDKLFLSAQQHLPLDDGGPASPDSGGTTTDPVDPGPPTDPSPF